MNTPRRRVLRSARPEPRVDPRQHPRMQKTQAILEKERENLTRWMARLKRAFHSVEKLQLRIARMERRLRQAHIG